MSLEGTVRNGVIVLDPGGPPLADGTRVEVAPRTGMEPLIRKTPGVIGGDACIGNRRISGSMAVRGATSDRKSTRLNSSHQIIPYAVLCLKKKRHILAPI